MFEETWKKFCKVLGYLFRVAFESFKTLQSNEYLYESFEIGYWTYTFFTCSLTIEIDHSNFLEFANLFQI